MKNLLPLKRTFTDKVKNEEGKNEVQKVEIKQELGKNESKILEIKQIINKVKKNIKLTEYE